MGKVKNMFWLWLLFLILLYSSRCHGISDYSHNASRMYGGLEIYASLKVFEEILIKYLAFVMMSGRSIIYPS